MPAHSRWIAISSGSSRSEQPCHRLAAFFIDLSFLVILSCLRVQYNHRPRPNCPIWLSLNRLNLQTGQRLPPGKVGYL